MGNKHRVKPTTTHDRGMPTITFRPRTENEFFWYKLKVWCKEQNISLGAVFNSYVPAIVVALENNCYEDGEDLYVRSDFGDIKICKKSEFTNINDGLLPK